MAAAAFTDQGLKGGIGLGERECVMIHCVLCIAIYIVFETITSDIHFQDTFRDALFSSCASSQAIHCTMRLSFLKN